jgi:hypothetical protein
MYLQDDLFGDIAGSGRAAGQVPADFMPSLAREEIRNLSRIVTSSGIKHAPNGKNGDMMRKPTEITSYPRK